MPIWLSILIGILTVLSVATTLLAIWLKPLFKLRKDVSDNTNRILKIEEHQTKDYKRAVRIETMQKCQIKALIAMLNNQISGHDEHMLRTVRDELQISLTDLL